MIIPVGSVSANAIAVYSYLHIALHSMFLITTLTSLVCLFSKEFNLLRVFRVLHLLSGLSTHITKHCAACNMYRRD